MLPRLVLGVGPSPGARSTGATPLKKAVSFLQPSTVTSSSAQGRGAESSLQAGMLTAAKFIRDVVLPFEADP